MPLNLAPKYLEGLRDACRHDFGNVDRAGGRMILMGGKVEIRLFTKN